MRLDEPADRPAGENVRPAGTLCGVDAVIDDTSCSTADAVVSIALSRTAVPTSSCSLPAVMPPTDEAMPVTSTMMTVRHPRAPR